MKKEKKSLNQKGMVSLSSNGFGMLLREFIFVHALSEKSKKIVFRDSCKNSNEYLLYGKYHGQDAKEKISNPVWHVHNGNPPDEKVVMPFQCF